MSIESANGALRLTTRKAFELIYKHVAGAFAMGRTPGNVMLHGTYGVGKSAGAEDLCTKISTCKHLQGKFNGQVHLIDVRAGSMQAADIQGIPYTAENGEFRELTPEEGEKQFVPLKDMYFSTPMFWPADANDDDGRPLSEKPIYIMFLDELKNAKNAEQHAIYRVLQERTCQNGKKLGANVFILGAGNINSDKTGSRELLPAAANRFSLHIEVDSSSKLAAEDFALQANEDGIDESIQAFILRNPMMMAPVDVSGNAVPRPRTWYAANSHLVNPLIEKKDLEDALIGCIGSSATVSFLAFRELRAFLPDFEKIAEGEKYDRENNGGDNRDDLSFYIAMLAANFIGDEMVERNKPGADKAEHEKRIENVIKMLIGEELGVEKVRNGKPVLDVGPDAVITADATLAMIRTWKNSDRFKFVLGQMQSQVQSTRRLMDIVLTKM